MLVISHSVGRKGVNDPADVTAVGARLVALGFGWALPGPGGLCSADLVAAIELFQAIKEGVDVVRHTRVDGRVDVDGQTLRWLGAANAPRWEALLPDRPGYHNHEATQGSAMGFATSWLNGVLAGAAAAYQGGYRSAHPGAAPLTANDASPARGGKAPPHKGHQTGLVCDLRLPNHDGTAGGLKTVSPHYDRAAMRAQLAALRTCPGFDRAYLNDAVLIAEGLCSPLAGHDDHVHFEIQVPPRA